MNLEKITVKYFAENEFCKEPYQASEMQLDMTYTLPKH